MTDSSRGVRFSVPYEIAVVRLLLQTTVDDRAAEFGGRTLIKLGRKAAIFAQSSCEEACIESNRTDNGWWRRNR